MTTTRVILLLCLLGTIMASRFTEADVLAHQSGPRASGASYAVGQAGLAAEIYHVRPDESLYSISSQYLSNPADWRTLQHLNAVKDIHQLMPGTLLRIPVALLRRTSLSAKVIAFSGSVEHASPYTPFVPVVRGLALHEGDRIRVGQDSGVSLSLPNGSHVTLPSNSSVLIRRLNTTSLTNSVDQQFVLEAGEIETHVTPLVKQRDVFRVVTPSAVAGVRGTSFRVVWKQERHLTAVEVINGQVDVGRVGGTASGVTQTISAGYGNLTVAGGDVGAPVKLLDAPQLIDPGKVQTGDTVSFDVAPIEAAKAYRAQLALDAAGLDIVRDRTSSSTHIDVGDLPSENYFVWLTAIDSQGLQGIPAVYAIKRRTSVILTSMDLVEEHSSYEFRWLQDRRDAATRYRFILATTPDLGAPMLDILDVGGNRLTVSGLSPGRYYWKVVSERLDGPRYHSAASPINSFLIGY